MDSKKVNSIPLQYMNHEGVMVTGNFMGEFNDATFNGDVSAMEGTFSGTLTVDSIDAANNINFMEGSAAVTTINTLDKVSNFDDDGVWRDVISTRFIAPSDEADEGGWAAIAMQYTVSDKKGNNDYFPVYFRILLDGVPIYTTPGSSKLGAYYKFYRTFSYAINTRVSSGEHEVTYQFKVNDYSTNMYAEFINIVMRVDYIRK